MPDPTDSLSKEIAQLRQELTVLNRHRFVRVHNNMWRLLGFQFLRGLALGLGTVMGATILVSVAVYLLSTIDFIPILGDWASAIAIQMKDAP